MPDLVTVVAAFGSVNAIRELAKDAFDPQVTAKIRAELADIHAELTDVNKQVLMIQEENKRLLEEMKKLLSYKLHHSVMWRERGDGTEDGPFCPVCTSDGLEMPLTVVPGSSLTEDHWLI